MYHEIIRCISILFYTNKHDKIKNNYVILENIRLSIKLCQKNILTQKKYDELGKYSSISYVRESQDVSLLAYTRCEGKKQFHAV